MKSDGERLKKKGFCSLGSGTAVPLLARAVPTYYHRHGLASYVRARPCHCRHGPCQLSGMLAFGQGMGWHGRATAGTGRAKLLAFQAQKFLSPSS